MMVLVSCQEDIGVGIAPGADDVVHAPTVLVPPVPGKRVVGDGRHRAQVRQTAPQSVAGADMRRMQRARLAAEEMLRQVVLVPQVEVADLGTLDAHDANEMARGHSECTPLARRDNELGDF